MLEFPHNESVAALSIWVWICFLWFVSDSRSSSRPSSARSRRSSLSNQITMTAVKALKLQEPSGLQVIKSLNNSVATAGIVSQNSRLQSHWSINVYNNSNNSELNISLHFCPFVYLLFMMNLIYLSFIQHAMEYMPFFGVFFFCLFLCDLRDGVSPVSMTAATLLCVTGEFSTR